MSVSQSSLRETSGQQKNRVFYPYVVINFIVNSFSMCKQSRWLYLCTWGRYTPVSAGLTSLLSLLSLCSLQTLGVGLKIPVLLGWHISHPSAAESGYHLSPFTADSSPLRVIRGLPWWFSGKESPANAGDSGSIRGPGRYHMLKNN